MSNREETTRGRERGERGRYFEIIIALRQEYVSQA